MAQDKGGKLDGHCVANDSASGNFAQLVTDEDGTTMVPTFDWADYFAPHMSKIVGVKKLHHSRFSADEPGVVYTKLRYDTSEKSVVPVLPRTIVSV